MTLTMVSLSKMISKPDILMLFLFGNSDWNTNNKTRLAFSAKRVLVFIVCYC